MDVSKKRCTDCKLRVPTFGLIEEGKVQWCAGCAKAHHGAHNLIRKMCEVSSNGPQSGRRRLSSPPV